MGVHARRLPGKAADIRIAAQHNIAPHHCIETLDFAPVFYNRKLRGGAAESAVELENALDVDELIHTAFEKSWRFVSTDPVLAHSDIDDLRSQLSRRLQRLAQDGERDVWRLANGAIGELRRELTAA